MTNDVTFGKKVTTEVISVSMVSCRCLTLAAGFKKTSRRSTFDRIRCRILFLFGEEVVARDSYGLNQSGWICRWRTRVAMLGSLRQEKSTL